MTKHSSADRSYGNMSLCIWFVSAASPAIAAFAVIGVRAAVVGSGKTIPHTAAAMVE